MFPKNESQWYELIRAVISGPITRVHYRRNLQRFMCNIKLFHSIFLLDYVMISTNNKTRNKKSSFNRFVGWLETDFFLHSICLARVRTYEPAASISTCRDWCSRFATRFFDKKVEACRNHVANPHELVENLAANLVKNQVCTCSQVCRWLE